MKKRIFKPKGLAVGLVLAILTLSTFVWIGCDKETQPITAPTAESQQPGSLSKAAGDINAVMAIQNRHTEALMAIRNVVGTTTTQLPDGRYAVKILTKVTGMEGNLPKVLEGMPVVVEEVGEIHALSFKERYRPVPASVSVGNINQCASGTIGCFVHKNGRNYILSNNHVLARNNAASIREDIVQPGRGDVPNCAKRLSDIVADLWEFKPITFSTSASNKIDAAMALMRPGIGFNCATACGPTPSSTPVTATIRMPIKKCGRTTRTTFGRVTGVNVTVLVDYGSGKLARFVGQIQTTDIADPGDSGSLIVTNDGTNRPVALLFAGSSTATFGNPIRDVLNYFGVTICGN
jgi:hypothetical protein